MLRPYADNGSGGSSSRAGAALVPLRPAARLDTNTSLRTAGRTSFTASTSRCVPNWLARNKPSTVNALVAPAQ
ncbi:MAG: hypothetical protein M5U12_35945 [Verrucomicrobia bacterium]|nr:hypothetical protein [Verrucomicrobiota bacterium]